MSEYQHQQRSRSPSPAVSMQYEDIVKIEPLDFEYGYQESNDQDLSMDLESNALTQPMADSVDFTNRRLVIPLVPICPKLLKIHLDKTSKKRQRGSPKSARTSNPRKKKIKIEPGTEMENPVDSEQVLPGIKGKAAVESGKSRKNRRKQKQPVKIRIRLPKTFVPTSSILRKPPKSKPTRRVRVRQVAPILSQEESEEGVEVEDKGQEELTHKPLRFQVKLISRKKLYLEEGKESLTPSSSKKWTSGIDEVWEDLSPAPVQKKRARKPRSQKRTVSGPKKQRSRKPIPVGEDGEPVKRKRSRKPAATSANEGETPVKSKRSRKRKPAAAATSIGVDANDVDSNAGGEDGSSQKETLIGPPKKKRIRKKSKPKDMVPPEIGPCSECQLKFHTEEELSTHECSKLYRLPNKMYKCALCPRTSKRKDDIVVHVRTHSKLSH